MLAAMRRTLSSARRLLNRVTLGLFLAQVATMVLLTVLESFRKKQRKLRRFPVTAPESLHVNRNEVTVYTYGADLYDAMIAAIDAATDHVYFETYIWKGDEAGQRFVDALARAADRGVDVYAVWDQFGNMVVPRSFYRSIPGNINTFAYPALPRPWSIQTWGFDHRKLMTVDGTVGFVGGYNIGSLYATGWRDTHCRVTGPDVAELENAFIDFWNMYAGKRHERIERNPHRGWQSQLRVHRNSPRLSVYPIRNMYLEAIDRATERIWPTHAYLIPDDDFVAALRDAAQRGVDVRIIVPAQSNHVVADWLSRGFYGNLLDSGIRLFLYQQAMVHSKTATIDGVWSTIGTANLDRVSLMGNYEVNLEVTDPEVAQFMEKVFRRDESNCIEVSADRWQGRSLAAKATEALLSPWRPIF